MMVMIRVVCSGSDGSSAYVVAATAALIFPARLSGVGL
jgi:hypothetical protein